MSSTIETIYRSNNEKPAISLILLDWTCRESFHIFSYLEKQTVPRHTFEIIWIEFYNRKPAEIAELIDNASPGCTPIIDQWILMNVPENYYYHKHAMYNVGIAAARGDIVCIMDSDAFMGEDFIKTILSTFEADPNIALHIDEVRNVSKTFYPFSYPTVEELLNGNCPNWAGQTTVGLLDNKTPLYTRNYGACLCAKRDAVLSIGGADEHLDYMGHVCGPYDLTFRLVNAGKRELWHPTEFIYHCWHPGTDGENNYIGPHDGRNNSTRALKARSTGRVLPYAENPALRELRLATGTPPAFEALMPQLLLRETVESWRFSPQSRLLSQCRQAYYGSRWEEAVLLFESMEEKPDLPEFLAEISRALFISQRQDTAVALLRKALALEPDNRLAACVIGWIMHNGGKHKEAVHWFDMALGGEELLQPDIVIEAMRGKAWSQLLLGKQTEAAQTFLQAAELCPGDSFELLAEINKGYAKATARIPIVTIAHRILGRAKHLAKRALGYGTLPNFGRANPFVTTGVLVDVYPEFWEQHRFGLPEERWESLAGKTIWVTGAGTGYGRCIAVALALAGAKVIISGRRPDKLKDCAKEARSFTMRTLSITPLVLDVADEDAVRRAVAQVRANSPELHGLVHCAALPQPGYRHPLLEMPLEDWNTLQRTNVTAGWLLTREAAGTLAQSGSLRVLFLGSEAGWASSVGHGPYNVSKAALNSLMASLAAEFAQKFPDTNPQINLLVPGEARTEMNQGSTVSPYCVVSMTLLLLTCGSRGPNGKIFHRDGRHLSFAYTTAYTGSILG